MKSIATTKARFYGLSAYGFVLQKQKCYIFFADMEESDGSREDWGSLVRNAILKIKVPKYAIEEPLLLPHSVEPHNFLVNYFC